MKKNQLIERYVYDVTRRVEKKSREEIEKELTSNIYDMLPDDATDEQIKEVLMNLGRPSDLAAKYRTNEKNYLISPKYFQDYVNVLKIAAIIVLSFTLIINIYVLAYSMNTIGIDNAILQFAAGISDALITSAFAVFAIVTVIFVIIERVNINEEKCVKPFSLDDLPQVPKHEKLEVNRISRIVGLVFSITFTLLFIYVMFNHQQYIRFYFPNNGETDFVIIFNDNIRYFIIPILILAGIDFANDLYKMTLGRKTQLTVAITTANSLLQILLLQVILTTKAIINPEFFAKLADIFETDVPTIMSNYELALPAIHATMLFVCVIVLTAQLIEFFEVRKLSRA